jgi:O-antigen biosynthesis protein
MLKELKEKYNHFRFTFMLRRENWSFYRLAIFFFSYRGQVRLWNFIKRIIRYLFRKLTGQKNTQSEHYSDWMRKHFADASKLAAYKQRIISFQYQPLISVILVKADELQPIHKAVECLQNQVYENWELLICGEKHDPTNTALIADKRIRFLPADSNTLTAKMNEAVDASAGEYITLLYGKDTLSPDALYQIIEKLNLDRSADMIYSDEDKIDEQGNHSDPYFKPDWNPDTFLSRNYLGGLLCIRRNVLINGGKFSNHSKSCAEYELMLRISEMSTSIVHIPHILYHRYSALEFNKVITDPCETCSNVIRKALSRRNILAKVTRPDPASCVFSIRYEIIHPGKVSIIMPTKNRAALCQVAINSIISLTSYTDYEIILVDNNSTEADFFTMVNQYRESLGDRFIYVKDDGDFNFSRIINNGVAHASGTYLLLLNNDTEIIHADWMTALVEQAQFKYNGVIGARLLYPNNTVQHAGVIVGLGGIAHHAFIGMDKDAAGYFNNLKAITNYSAVTAACCMVRKDNFTEVGGFDESLAVEFNDVDFCLKLKEKGCNNIYLPHVTLYHHESISRGHPHKTRESYKRHLADLTEFKNRWQKYIDHDPCYNPHLSRIYTDFRIRV